MTKNLKILIDSSMMDGREGKGTAIVIKNFLERLSIDSHELDITLIHKHKSDNQIYESFKEIVIPRIWNKLFGGTINEFLFFIIFWLKILIGKEKKFNVHFVPYSRILPSFFISPAKKRMFFPMDGGPKTANYSLEKVKTPFPWFVRLLKGRIDGMLALTQFGKDGIVHEIGVSAEKVFITGCGLEPSFQNYIPNLKKVKEVKQKYSYPEKFILCVSRLDPHKNILNLLKGYKIYKDKNSDYLPLVMVGGKHMPDYSIKVDNLIKELELTKDVTFSKYVEVDDFPYVYAAAEFKIFPSLYEGFGIPVIEAQKCGCPVLVSHDKALNEVGGDAVISFNGYDPDDIAVKIGKVQNDKDLRLSMSQKGLLNQVKYSWDDGVIAFIKCIESFRL